MSRTSLTYEDEYEIAVKVEFAGGPMQVDYAGCGSHALAVAGKVELTEARRLHRDLSLRPGIKDQPGAHVTRDLLHQALELPACHALVNGVFPLLEILCAELGIGEDDL